MSLRASASDCDTTSDESTNTCSSSSSSSPPLNEPSDTPFVPGNKQKDSRGGYYIQGLQMKVWRHTPPAPFGIRYTTPRPTHHPDATTVSLEELCFQSRPREGHTFYENTKQLFVTAIIRSGIGTGPQVLIVNHNMIAKIYDPLYYDTAGYIDVVRDADRAYSCEAAAYEHLQNAEDVSDILPDFYGTWTMDVEATVVRDRQLHTYIRPVRMILMEYLGRQCMADVAAWKLSSHARTTILKQCLDAQIRLHHAGVVHGDLSPRNVMLMGSDLVTPNVHVKMIDFELCSVHDHPNYKFRKWVLQRREFERKWAPKLMSPVKFFFQHMDEFSCQGWCPGGYGEAEEWLWEQYGNDNRYIPVRFVPPNNDHKTPLYADACGRIDDPDSKDDGN